MRFSPFIGLKDMQTALERVKRFLGEGNLVKISIFFTGRQMAHQEFGPKLLQKIMDELNEIAQQDRDARFEGRRFVTIVRPTNPKQNKVDKKNESQNQKSSNQTV